MVCSCRFTFVCVLCLVVIIKILDNCILGLWINFHKMNIYLLESDFSVALPPKKNLHQFSHFAKVFPNKCFPLSNSRTLFFQTYFLCVFFTFTFTCLALAIKYIYIDVFIIIIRYYILEHSHFVWGSVELCSGI